MKTGSCLLRTLATCYTVVTSLSREALRTDGTGREALTWMMNDNDTAEKIKGMSC
jgi:hypothetical protein